MQNIIIYLRAGDVAAKVVDEYNQTAKTISHNHSWNPRDSGLAADGYRWQADRGIGCS